MRTRGVVLWGVAGAAILGLLSLRPSAAEPKADPLPSIKELAAELVQLRDRVDRLEQRVAGLGGKPGFLELKVDRHGIIRDPAGKPVGYWGIDYPTRQRSRSRNGNR
ncbi:MAG TPA: hypothetical protein VMV69_20615 [Pirellulales bacterium]|nr:hypothetical protein [Pirellulales bacterium]